MTFSIENGELRKMSGLNVLSKIFSQKLVGPIKNRSHASNHRSLVNIDDQACAWWLYDTFEPNYGIRGLGGVNYEDTSSSVTVGFIRCYVCFKIHCWFIV